MDEQMHRILDNIRDAEISSRVQVKIPFEEAERITVNRLIQIRNDKVEREDMSHFDKVIRFFLDEEEFQKYVIEQKPIEF